VPPRSCGADRNPGSGRPSSFPRRRAPRRRSTGPRPSGPSCRLRSGTRLVSGAPTIYALGWTVASLQLAGVSARMVSHRGSRMGGTVSLLTFPDLGLAIAAAANVTNAIGVDPFARHRRRGVHPISEPSAQPPGGHDQRERVESTRMPGHGAAATAPHRRRRRLSGQFVPVRG
jgi:hypothetical protein